MTTQTKVKVSISISEDILREIDREAASGERRTRSSVIESWLRRAHRRVAEARLASETIAYYQALSEEERHEDREWGQYASQAFAELDDDQA